MEYKYIVDWGYFHPDINAVEVWKVNHVSQSIKSFPYNPSWWEEQDEDIRKTLHRREPMSQTLEEAVTKAREFYDKLPYQPAPKERLLIGRVDHRF